MKRLLALTTAATCATVLAACGRPGSSGVTNAPVGKATASAAMPLPKQPGTVVIGSADFPENEILADIYADAFRARGVKVSVHADIGERPAYLAALDQGSIGAIPEYSGSILDYLDNGNLPRTPAEVYKELQNVAGSHGNYMYDGNGENTSSDFIDYLMEELHFRAAKQNAGVGR